MRGVDAASTSSRIRIMINPVAAPVNESSQYKTHCTLNETAINTFLYITPCKDVLSASPYIAYMDKPSMRCEEKEADADQV